jgi:hypothetical protein
VLVLVSVIETVILGLDFAAAAVHAFEFDVV